MTPRRIYSHSDNNGRTVTIGGVGNLNERFSQLNKSVHTETETRSNSVFSRIRTTTVTQTRQSGNVFGRLGKASHAGVQKRTVPGRAQGTRRESTRRPQPSQPPRGVNRGRAPARAGQSGRNAGRQQGRSSQRAKSGKPKKLTADDLDKSLDDYMMKDEKIAQSKLNEELTAYMDQAEDDVNMET